MQRGVFRRVWVVMVVIALAATGGFALLGTIAAIVDLVTQGEVLGGFGFGVGVLLVAVLLVPIGLLVASLALHRRAPRAAAGLSSLPVAVVFLGALALIIGDGPSIGTVVTLVVCLVWFAVSATSGRWPVEPRDATPPTAPTPSPPTMPT